MDRNFQSDWSRGKSCGRKNEYMGEVLQHGAREVDLSEERGARKMVMVGWEGSQDPALPQKDRD